MPSPLPSTSLSNGNVNSANSVESNNGESSVAHRNGVVMDRESSMEQSKEKARAIVASSGLSNTKSPSPSAQSSQSAASKLPNGQINGTSRKRSRSGTRLPAQDDYTPEFREQRKEAVLERLVQREQLHAMNMVENSLKKDAMLHDFKRQGFGFARQKEAITGRYPGTVFGIGYAGYGNGFQDLSHLGYHPMSHPRIVTLEHHKRPGGRMTRLLRIPRKEIAIQAEQIDELIPIRLDIEWDKVRLRDTFTWNLNDRTVDVVLFAHQLVEDMNLDPRQCMQLVQQVIQSIKEQIHDYHPHIFTVEEPLDPHLPYFAYKNDEIRILIKLHITIGPHTLMDQFEWDINDYANNPEEFAKLMTKELQLNGEFTTAIAHSIREQCQAFTKSLYAVGHPFDGRPIEDHEIQANLQPSPISAPFRPHQVANSYTPYMFDMDESAFEKSELNLSREERRQKRSVNRRGGPVLPDLRDKRRTVRSLVVSSVIPGAVMTQEESRLFKRPAVSNRGRRGIARDELEESDESGSEASEIGSPAIPAHLLTGTARTRAIRDASLKSQAATRSALARSSTPDSMIQQHEPRSSNRRVIRDDSSPEPQPSVIVRLRLPRSVIQQIRRNDRAKSKDGFSSTPGRPHSRQSSAAPGLMGPPVVAPRSMSHGNTPGITHKAPGGSSAFGRVDAIGPPGPDYPSVSILVAFLPNFEANSI